MHFRALFFLRLLIRVPEEEQTNSYGARVPLLGILHRTQVLSFKYEFIVSSPKDRTSKGERDII